MAKFTADLSCLSALLKPNQDMANLISVELARGLSKVPAYTPFIVPRIAEPPRAMPSDEHSADIGKWRHNARQAKRE